jgi:hypothetical protein
MPKLLQFQNYIIEEEPTELELNYVVKDETGYICRLVPGYAGFDLSPLDKSLGIELPPHVLASISEFIVEHD